MSDKPDLAKRLQTVQRILTYLAQEVTEITTEVRKLMPAAQIQSIPFSAASAEGVDLEAVIADADRAAESKAKSSWKPPIEESATSFAVKKMYLGADSVLVHYLAEGVIAGGEGAIKPNGIVRQYEDDLLGATPSTLVLWPAGFYRNHTTMDMQLLLKSSDRRTLVCIDGLPSNTPRVIVYSYQPEQSSFELFEMVPALALNERECSAFRAAMEQCVHSSLPGYHLEALNQAAGASAA